MFPPNFAPSSFNVMSLLWSFNSNLFPAGPMCLFSYLLKLKITLKTDVFLENTVIEGRILIAFLVCFFFHVMTLDLAVSLP